MNKKVVIILVIIVVIALIGTGLYFVTKPKGPVGTMTQPEMAENPMAETPMVETAMVETSATETAIIPPPMIETPPPAIVSPPPAPVVSPPPAPVVSPPPAPVAFLPPVIGVPASGLIPPASECPGYDCTIEGQMCLPGTMGAGPNTYKCINKKWVQQNTPPAVLPAPFSKGDINQTPWNSEGGGQAIFLDRHDINCNNKPINRFKLVRKGDGNMAYEYNCSEGGILKSPTTYSNPPSEANNNAVYLDRQPITCDKNSLLSRMQLVNSPDKTWKYNYNCVMSEKELSCRDVSTPWNEEGGGNALYLDRHDVKCENDESLSSIALVRKGDGNYRYNYKCCKSTPAASATVTGGSVQLSSPLKFVRISRTASSPGGNLSININEIQAYDASNNLIPFTISMYGPDSNAADGLVGFPASNAVDGNLNNFAHTIEAMKSFLQVGLASETPIAKLVVYPRPDFKNRMIGTKIEFLNGNGQEAAPSININEEKNVYTFQFRSLGLGLGGGASAWLASRINLPQYLRHLQNKNYLSY